MGIASNIQTLLIGKSLYQSDLAFLLLKQNHIFHVTLVLHTPNLL